jgi:hypothetical protein
MGHSKTRWHLKKKPRPKRSSQESGNICRLCGHRIFPGQKTRDMFINHWRVTVHDSC